MPSQETVLFRVGHSPLLRISGGEGEVSVGRIEANLTTSNRSAPEAAERGNISKPITPASLEPLFGITCLHPPSFEQKDPQALMCAGSGNTLGPAGRANAATTAGGACG